MENSSLSFLVYGARYSLKKLQCLNYNRTPLFQSGYSNNDSTAQRQ